MDVKIEQWGGNRQERCVQYRDVPKARLYQSQQGITKVLFSLLGSISR